MTDKPLLDMGDAQWDIVKGILQKHVPDREVWAFGSRAKWTAKEFSDLDLAVIGQKSLPLEVSAALAEDFSESDLPWKVDVVDGSVVSAPFRQIIERDKVVVQKPQKKLGGWGMSSEWLILKIEDVAERVGMGPFGSSIKVETFVESGVPVISGEHLHDFTLTEKKFRFITEQHANQLAKSNVFRGDVVFTHAGTIGQVSVIPENSKYEKYIISQRQFFMRCKRELVNPLYVVYFFKSPQGRHKLLANASQVGVPSIARPVTYLRSIEIPIPSLEVQNRIVSVIESIHDRITLLHETNKTLEAIAQALFKSWFVDFDPVRAKAEGRLPEGIDESTAALFPDVFEESELGMVPSGWNIEPLDKVASFLNGLALQKFPPTGQGDLPVIKIAQLRKGDTIGADLAAGAIKSEYIIKNGDVLFSWSGSLEVDIWCGGDGALNQHLFKVTSSRFEKWFYYLWTKHHLESFRQIAASKATTMGHIQRSHLTLAKVVVPSDQILAIANGLFAPLVDRIVENTLQANTLSNLRDTLLPRLISGQLRIADAEIEPEKAMA